MRMSRNFVKFSKTKKPLKQIRRGSTRNNKKTKQEERAVENVRINGARAENIAGKDKFLKLFEIVKTLKIVQFLMW